MSGTVYLDYNATTPVDPRVLEVMLPVLAGPAANPASAHAFGRTARRLVEQAREQVAGAVDSGAGRVVFVSGATESVNLAIKGLTSGELGGRTRILTFGTEHKAVLDAAAATARAGVQVTVLGVSPSGEPDLDALADTIDDHTLLVSMMAANNETGVIGPLATAAEMAHAAGALFHTDATQALGKTHFSFGNMGVDMASVSSHKIYGPQGVGALIVTSDAAARLTPLIDGGGHERGLRSGTLNTVGCVGFGAAAELARAEWRSDADRLCRLRDRLEAELTAADAMASINGAMAPRLPGTANIRFGGADADAVMMAMPEVAVSTGSACSSAAIGPSHVLIAMGLDQISASESLRFSLGRPSTDADVEAAVRATLAAVRTVRNMEVPVG